MLQMGKMDPLRGALTCSRTKGMADLFGKAFCVETRKKHMGTE